MYCVKCKKVTDTSNEQLGVGRNKRNMHNMLNHKNAVYQGWIVVK